MYFICSLYLNGYLYNNTMAQNQNSDKDLIKISEMLWVTIVTVVYYHINKI